MTRKEILTKQKKAIKSRLECIELMEQCSEQQKESVADIYVFWTREDSECTIQLANFKEPDSIEMVSKCGVENIIMENNPILSRNSDMKFRNS